MKKLIVIVFMLICNVAISQTSWYVQTCPTTKNLLDIFFINQQTGWACGDSGKIIKTTNGGLNWTLKTTPTFLPLLAIRFSDSNYGYAVGGINDQNPFCMYPNVVIKTTNGGENWIFPQTQNQPWDIYYDAAVINKDTAFVTFAGSNNSCSGSSGGSYRTFDGGVTWTQFGGGHIKGISFINSNTGWIANYDEGGPTYGLYSLYKTTNTGLNWNLVYRDSLITNPGKIRFVDNNNGYCVKTSLRKTTNGGVNWQKVDSVTVGYVRSFSLASKDTLWVINGLYTVVRTNNGGINWAQQLTAGVLLNSIFFIDKNTGWIAGNSGIILKTVTGGVTGVQNISSEVPSSYSLSQNYPNPFNSMCNVQFSIYNAGNVKLVVYDIQGREVQTLVNERLQAGTYEATFDARHGGSASLNSGVYFYRLTVRHGGSSTDGFSETKRMVLIK